MMSMNDADNLEYQLDKLLPGIELKEVSVQKSVPAFIFFRNKNPLNRFSQPAFIENHPRCLIIQKC